MTLFGPEEIFKNKKAVNDNDEFYIIGVDNILKFNMSLDDVTLSNMVPHHYHTISYFLQSSIVMLISPKSLISIGKIILFFNSITSSLVKNSLFLNFDDKPPVTLNLFIRSITSFFEK